MDDSHEFRKVLGAVKQFAIIRYSTAGFVTLCITGFCSRSTRCEMLFVCVRIVVCVLHCDFCVALVLAGFNCVFFMLLLPRSCQSGTVCVHA